MNAIVSDPLQSIDDADDLSPWWPRPVSPKSEPIDRSHALGMDLAYVPLIMRVSNVPTDETIAATIDWRAEAAPMLAEWKRVWDGLFATQDLRIGSHDKNEGPRNAKRHAFAGAAATFKYEESESWDKTKGSDGRAGKQRCLRLALDEAGMAAWRPWQAHVVDDAETVLSMGDATSGRFWMVVQDYGGVPCRIGPGPVLETTNRIGRPVSSVNIRTAGRSVPALVLQTHSGDEERGYWRSPAFLSHAGRGFAPAPSHYDAVLVLLAMAREGRTKAFLKGAAGKAGTWTVDLSGVRTPADAAGRLAAALFPEGWPPQEGCFVQEHLPFTHEQRFFVVGGRIAASVCSARSMTALDAVRGRILDPRVARLVRPEVDEGTYDRGGSDVVEDRALAAAFARKARAVVRDLAVEGWRDFVLDMGMTERGILPVEINPLNRSGPYCLDRKRIVRAKDAHWTRTVRSLRRRVVEIVGGRVPSGTLEDVVDRVLPPDETWSSLATRILHVEQRTESDRRPLTMSRISDRLGGIVEEVLAVLGDGSVPSTLDPGLDLEPVPERSSERLVASLLPGWKHCFSVPLGQMVHSTGPDVLVCMMRSSNHRMTKLSLLVVSTVEGRLQVDPVPFETSSCPSVRTADAGSGWPAFLSATEATQVPGRHRFMRDRDGRRVQLVWTGVGDDAVLSVQVETESGATVGILPLPEVAGDAVFWQWKPGSAAADPDFRNYRDFPRPTS